MSGQEVTVNIYGNEFTLRTQDDPAQLQGTAAEVDRAMRQMADESGVMQAHRVATLTALSMADELHKLRAESADLSTRVVALVERLDAAVGSGA